MKLEEKFNSSIPNWLRHYLDELDKPEKDTLIKRLLGTKKTVDDYGDSRGQKYNDYWREWEETQLYAAKIPERSPMAEWDKITFYPGPVPTSTKDPRIKNKENILFMEVQTVRYNSSYDRSWNIGKEGSMEVVTDLYIRGMNDDTPFKLNTRANSWRGDERGSGNRAYKYTKMNELLNYVVNFCYIDSEDLEKSKEAVKSKEAEREKMRSEIHDLNNNPLGYSRKKYAGSKVGTPKSAGQIDKSGYKTPGLDRFIKQLALMRKNNYAKDLQEWDNTIKNYENTILEKLQQLNELVPTAMYYQNINNFNTDSHREIDKLVDTIDICKKQYLDMLRADRSSKELLKGFIRVFNSAFNLDAKQEIPDSSRVYIDPETGEGKHWQDEDGNILRPYEEGMWKEIAVDTLFTDGSEAAKKYGKGIGRGFRWELPSYSVGDIPANTLKARIADEQKKLKEQNETFDAIVKEYNELIRPNQEAEETTPEKPITENYKNHLTKLDALIELKDED